MSKNAPTPKAVREWLEQAATRYGDNPAFLAAAAEIKTLKLEGKGGRPPEPDTKAAKDTAARMVLYASGAIGPGGVTREVLKRAAEETADRLMRLDGKTGFDDRDVGSVASVIAYIKRRPKLMGRENLINWLYQQTVRNQDIDRSGWMLGSLLGFEPAEV